MRVRSTLSCGCLAAVLVTPVPALADPASGEAAVVLDEGRAKQKVALYDDAAARYETFARMSPTADEAPQALQDAVVLRLGLGQIELASKDAELFARVHGSAHPERAARVSLAVGTTLLEKEDWAAARKPLQAWVVAFDGHAPLDARIVAHAGLARALVKLRAPGARPQADYGVVRDLWKDPLAAVASVRAASPPGEEDRHLARAITGVGEALFYFAEQKRNEADKIRMPAFRGRSNRDEILRFVSTQVPVWVREKRSAIEAAEQEYLKVVEIQPVPPPRWVVASASRVGALWGKFVAEFRAAPVPREWRQHTIVPGTTITYDELRNIYYGALDSATEPLLARATAAFKTCANYAVKYQFESEYTRRCFDWLEKHHTAHYLRIDELVPQPVWLGAASTPPSDPDRSPRERERMALMGF